MCRCIVNYTYRVPIVGYLHAQGFEVLSRPPAGVDNVYRSCRAPSGGLPRAQRKRAIHEPGANLPYRDDVGIIEGPYQRATGLYIYIYIHIDMYIHM